MLEPGLAPVDIVSHHSELLKLGLGVLFIEVQEIPRSLNIEGSGLDLAIFRFGGGVIAITDGGDRGQEGTCQWGRLLGLIWVRGVGTEADGELAVEGVADERAADGQELRHWGVITFHY